MSISFLPIFHRKWRSRQTWTQALFENVSRIEVSSKSEFYIATPEHVEALQNFQSYHTKISFAIANEKQNRVFFHDIQFIHNQENKHHLATTH